MSNIYANQLRKLFNKKPHVHFIGIGGIGMSGLAGVCLHYGFTISGSDLSKNHNTDKLEEAGASIFYHHDANNIKDCDIVVFSSAIKSDNPEMVQALKANKCIIERHKFLGIIFNNFDRGIAVSGSHGKTTCCGMLSNMLIAADADPQIFIGGNMKLLNGLNYRKGEGCCLAEACEYKKNFLSLRPFISVILNIENDHMDFFKDTQQLIDAFSEFSDNTKKDGTIIINGDDQSCKDLKTSNDKKVITFGFDKTNYCFASNIKRYKGRYNFTLVYNKQEYKVKLSVFGKHNIMNALAAFCVVKALGLDEKKAITALYNFKGVGRRFEYTGNFNGAEIIKDYAHHPRELQAVINSAKEIYKGKIAGVFQPHTYSRTKALMSDFCDCFNGLDYLIILPVYSAREKYDKQGSSAALYDNLKNKIKTVVYLDSFSQASEYLKSLKVDAILVLGAGDIDKLADIMVKPIF